MTTPQISGKYQFQLELKGLRLPVTFTVPDIPDTPPSEEQFDPSPSSIVTDKESVFEETSIHTDPLDTVHIEVDQPSIPHVSAYLLCACITGQRVRVEHGR